MSKKIRRLEAELEEMRAQVRTARAESDASQRMRATAEGKVDYLTKRLKTIEEDRTLDALKLGFVPLSQLRKMIPAGVRTVSTPRSISRSAEIVETNAGKVELAVFEALSRNEKPGSITVNRATLDALRSPMVEGHGAALANLGNSLDQLYGGLI